MRKDYRAQYEKVKGLSWEEFMSLDEVQVDASPSGKGNALYYNDKTVQTSVDFEGHDEHTLWKDEKLAEELKAQTLKEMLEELSWERVYVLSTQKKGDIFEDVYPSMEEAVSYGKDALASKNGYTEAIAYALEEPDWENYKNGDIALGLGDLAEETVIVTLQEDAK